MEQRLLQHLQEQTLCDEVEGDEGAHRTRRAVVPDEGGRAAPASSAAAGREPEDAVSRQQPGGAVVLLARHGQAGGQTRERQPAPPIGSVELHAEEDGRREAQLRRRRVAVHVPVGKRPDLVEEDEADGGPRRRAPRQSPHQQMDDHRERGELEHQDPTRYQDRGAEGIEGEGEQVEGPGQGQQHRVAVELAAAVDEIRELEDVALVEQAHRAIEHG
jgi:hypothetical protein